MESLQSAFFDLPIFISFLGGLLSFLSPCILPLIPSYMSYISGTAINNIESNNIRNNETLSQKCIESNNTKTSQVTIRANRFYIFRSSLLFIAGFSLVFFLLFLAMINVIQNFFNYRFVNYISGGIIILFGLHFLGIFQLKILNNTTKLNLQKLESNRFLKIIAPFIIGVGFAAGWTPCTGPIVSSIGLLAASSESLAIISSLSFIVGLAVPFLILALFIEKGLNFVRKLKKQMHVIEKTCGFFLIIVGILVACDLL
ncbi:cytochrome C biogenesis protein CcdA [Helicobacter saguini]|uniref:Cytochrome C biogenesis protein CcdA n=1 Tax=Helicobacter saguini TaxID=1548018 RepID=A0A347VPM4_9HELI|nr:cytochrome c biogenesis protein CcdA [Helicobacter saguini]MWV61295.1 cytochrome C biogenesis protein CcdA [Helicobacter saguini]MWV68036.1 cytochrome C biogenesis protein CcdA [Helicobacter saguini]MWV70497.1 cytochrome C biogenesis protein CcdA [Helicobacter saguini]MWV72401.1 cytochrome C biogenesis protein CcdA [Helicobacter saguini]TLD91852.1 cytochrome C biogenesis protein CcdA [Helicobacter saguini]